MLRLWSSGSNRIRPVRVRLIFLGSTATENKPILLAVVIGFIFLYVCTVGKINFLISKMKISIHNLGSTQTNTNYWVEIWFIFEILGLVCLGRWLEWANCTLNCIVRFIPPNSEIWARKVSLKSSILNFRSTINQLDCKLLLWYNQSNGNTIRALVANDEKVMRRNNTIIIRMSCKLMYLIIYNFLINLVWSLKVFDYHICHPESYL